MANVTARPRLAGRSPVEFVVDRIWRFFCSVRAAVAEIIFLTLLVLMGTLAGSEVPQWLADAAPFTQPFVDWWYGYNWFHSFPFELILMIQAIAITICTINRVPGIWHTISKPTIQTTRGFMRNADPSAELTSTATPVVFTSQLGDLLKARRYRVLTAENGNETHIYADKNRFAKLGTFPFHLALILILVGGIVGARYGFRNKEFIVSEGSTLPVGHGTGLSLELERFTDTYLPNAQPHKYESDVVIYKDGKPVKSGPIIVNHPMTYDGVTFYQSAFGNAASLRITDSKGNVLYNDSVPVGIYTARFNPDQPAGILHLPQGYQINVIAPSTSPGAIPPNLPADVPGMEALTIQSGQMYIEARRNDAPVSTNFVGAVVNQGETKSIDGLNIQFVRERRWAGLQVSHNPGIPIFFLAALLLVGGLAVTFYFPHRRIRGIVAATPGGAEAELAPLARRDWSGKRDFHRFLEDVEQQLDLRPTVIERKPPPPRVAAGTAAKT